LKLKSSLMVFLEGDVDFIQDAAKIFALKEGELELKGIGMLFGIRTLKLGISRSDDCW
jgi:hypothetical protein